MKKIVAFAMALVLSVGFSIQGNALQIITNNDTVVYVNPLYADIVTEDEIISVHREGDTGTVRPSAGITYADTIEEAADVLRPQLIDRKEEAVVYFTAPAYLEEDVYAIFDAAVEHNGNPVAGDSLAWVYAGYECSISGSDYGYYVELCLCYYPKYYTTAEQEKELDKEVEKLLKSLDLDGKDDYQKVCAIYDYICDNITYDYANLNDDDYKLKYTAYAALIDKTAVCQGYALLFYRLALEEGIDARLIAGTGNGGPHGWNIVQMGDYYYNLDSTWDAGYSSYNYFLLNEKNFTENGTDHLRYDEYNTKEFHAEYPIGPSNYIYDPDDFSGALDDVTGSGTTVTGDINGDGVVDVKDAYMARLIAAKLVASSDTQKQVGDIDGDGKITAIDANYIRRYAGNFIEEFP